MSKYANPDKLIAKLYKQLEAKFRCAALDDHGKRCKRKDTKPYEYFGDNELYGSLALKGPAWVRVYLCGEHKP